MVNTMHFPPRSLCMKHETRRECVIFVMMSSPQRFFETLKYGKSLVAHIFITNNNDILIVRCMTSTKETHPNPVVWEGQKIFGTTLLNKASGVNVLCCTKEKQGKGEACRHSNHGKPPNRFFQPLAGEPGRFVFRRRLLWFFSVLPEFFFLRSQNAGSTTYA